MIEYTFIKSKRRTIGITVKPDGSVIVRAPLNCSQRRAEAFVNEKQAWIERAQARMAKRREEGMQWHVLSKLEIDNLKSRAKQVIPQLVAEQAKLMGVTYGTVSIRAQKTRWGSCSSKGNLNFNCMLVLLPENVQRYVVVHELCHRIEMNHSAAFWRCVEKWQPSYREDRKELRRKGSGLLEFVIEKTRVS